MTRFEDYLAKLQRFGIQPGLERVAALLTRFGEPQCKFPHILVGGTNGKGSTCEFLARLLSQNEAQIGLFTSPHLYRWNERIRLISADSGKDAPENRTPFPDAIDDADLDALFANAKPHFDAVAADLGQPTEFESLTALAIWHFARREVNAAVLEVGLGGKWDATNVADPLVSVITHVALDHCDRLGDTLEAIAADKIEIARTGRILLTAETKPEVLRVFHDYCKAHSVRFWPIFAPDWSNNATELEHCRAFMKRHATSGNGSFQHQNQQTALAAFYAFQTELNRSVATSLTEIPLSVPGRLEIVREPPRVVLDVCNNPDGAAHLAAALRDELKTTPQNLILVLGILGDKDFAAMTAILAPMARIVIATQSQSPRAVIAEAIAKAAQPYCQHVETIPNVPTAYTRALQLAKSSDIICIAGSFTTVGEIQL